MSLLNIHIRDWLSWIPGEESVPRTLPQALRRRITPIGKEALNVAWGLSGSSNARLIFSSRYGEFSRTISLLQSIVSNEELSPADFTLSVHHALIGLLSIVQGNRRGHTAIAAGSESFCFGLLEAAICLKENPNQPIVLIHCDDRLPPPYSEFNEPGGEPIVLALFLTLNKEDEGFSFGSEPITKPSGPPQSHALQFRTLLEGDVKEVCSVDAERAWKWMRHAAD